MKSIKPIQSNNELSLTQNRDLKKFSPMSTSLTTHYFNLFLNCSSWDKNKSLLGLLNNLQNSDLKNSKSKRKDFEFIYSKNQISFFITYWADIPNLQKRKEKKEKLVIEFNFKTYFQSDSDNNSLKNYPILFNYLLSKIIADSSTVNLKDRTFLKDSITFDFSDLYGIENDKMYSRRSIAKSVFTDFIKNFSTISFKLGQVDGFFNFVKGCIFEKNKCTIYFSTITGESLPPPFFINLFLDSYIDASKYTFTLNSKEFLLYAEIKYRWKQKGKDQEYISIKYKYILEKIINRKLDKHNSELLTDINNSFQNISEKIIDENISFKLLENYSKLSTDEIIENGFVLISLN